MSKTDKERGASQVELPEGLAVRIRKVIRKGEYRTISDFVRDAIRRRLEELEMAGHSQ